MKNRLFGISLLAFLIFGVINCTPAQSRKKSKGKNKNQQTEEPYQINFSKYQKDYKVYNPDNDSLFFKGQDSIFVYNDSSFLKDNYLSDSLVLLMDTLSKLNHLVPFSGYRIVLYTGPDRQKALITKGKAMKVLSPETRIYYNYERPYFRVKAGNYFDRTSAFPTFLRVKRMFPTALLVPEEIDVQRIQFE